MLVYTALTNSNISYYKFVLINNVLKEYDDTKEEKKNWKEINSSLKILVDL